MCASHLRLALHTLYMFLDKAGVLKARIILYSSFDRSLA